MDQSPGRLFDVGGFRLHLNDGGHGWPTVVFDAALGGSSLSWCFVQPQVARWTRACSYDRAGLGWSDPGPTPRTIGRIAAELRELLQRAEAPPPYVLVGHSFGTLVARMFAARYRADVAGLVLVEPAFPEDWIEPNAGERRRMRRGVRLCRYGATAARLRLVNLTSSLMGSDGLSLARAAASFGSRRFFQREHKELVSPIQKLPARERAFLKWMWTQPRFFHALGSQIESIGVSARELLEAGESLEHVPLAVVSAANPHPHHIKMQEALVRSSSKSRRIVADSSGHWVPLDHPEVVVNAVRDVVTQVRGPRRA